MAGLSREQIEDLEELDPGKFEPGQWVALCWTRSFFRENGNPNAAIQARFEDTFNSVEQDLIRAAVKSMFVFNLTSNTARRWLQRFRVLLSQASL